MSETTQAATEQADGVPEPLAEAAPTDTTSVLASPKEPTPAPAPPPSVEPIFYLRGLLAITAGLLLVALLVVGLKFGEFIFKPLLIACFLGYVLAPVQHWFQRQGLPRWPTAVIMLLTVLTLLVGLGYLESQGLYYLDEAQLARYEAQFDRAGQRLLGQVGLSKYAEDFHVRKLVFSSQELTTQLRSAFVSLVGTFFNFVMVSVMVFLYLVFLWLEWSDLPGRVDQAFGQERGAVIREVAGQINVTISRYLGVLTLLCLSQGIVATATLGLLGTDFFVLWGVLIFLLCYIPYFGPFISISLAVLFTFMQYPHQPWRGVVALVVLASVNQLCDNFLNPRLNGRGLGASPLLMLLALSFWGALWGVVGLILAVPLTVTVKIILARIDATRPVAILMSDR
jgi:predicted PurR-regulated permease PerM